MNVHVSALSSQPFCDERPSMSAPDYRQNFRSDATELEPCKESFAAFLRDLYPRDTGAHVEADSRGRIPAGTVEKWLQLVAFPRAAHQFLIVGLYGPGALAAMFRVAPPWLDDAVRAAEIREVHEARRRLDERLRRLQGA